MPFLLIIGSFFVNYNLNSNNEIVILKQYLGFKKIYSLLSIMMFGLFIVYFINNEFFSVKMYHKYKIEELNIRNNLKLGTPSQNEFHIDNEVSIFFEKKEDEIFHNIEAIIYDEGQFIKSGSAEIEILNKNFNLIFYNGQRLILNSNEKSKTNFDKFIFTIENTNIEDLLMDRDHFNTLQLINHNNKEFKIHGYNKIYQYILSLVIIFLSFKIIFLYEPKKNLIKKFTLIFIFLLLMQIINSYTIYLYNNNSLNLLKYYFSNFSLLLLFIFFVNRVIK